MKKLRNLKQYAFIILSVLAIAACEKEETEIVNDSNDLSTEKKIIELESEILLHKSYSGNLSQEESTALFNEDVKKYISENKNKSLSVGWSYTLYTKTGNNGTNGTVMSTTTFLSENSTYFIGKELNRHDLDENGNEYNDRLPNKWDYYFLTTNAFTTPDWLELESVLISLEGTDGWDLESLKAYMFDNHQNVPATGATHLQSEPNTKLDNCDDDCTSIYFTGNIGIGRLTF